MQLKNKIEKFNKIAAILAIIGLIAPSPAYSARPAGIRTGRSELRTQLENDLLAQGGIFRSEMRSSGLSWTDFDLKSQKKELASNLSKFGLKIKRIQYVPLRPMKRMPFYESLKSRLAFEIIQSQAIAGAGYVGVAEGKEKDQVSILKKEGDANAVSVGAESLRELAEFYDVRIIVIGNEGATRDQAAAIPNLKIYNQGGKNGTVLFLNDSIEGTNYVLKGQLGGWAIIALLDENNSYSTDGYRDTVSYRAKRDAGIDPVIRRENTVERIFTQIARANDQELKVWAEDKHVVILGDRKRHEAAITQLEELKKTSGLTYETVADGDFVPRTLQAAFGMRTSQEGREVVVIGAGGANEHKMSLVAVYLSKPDENGRKGFAASRYITYDGLKDSMENADNFSQTELEELASLNTKIDSQKLPVGKVTSPSAIETEGSIQGKAVLAGTAITGARPADLDLYRNELPAVSMTRTEGNAGQIVTNSFLIDEDGTPYLIRAAYETADLLNTRLTILSNNPFRPEKTVIHSNVEKILSIIENLETYPMTFATEEMTEVINDFDLMLQNLRTLDHFLQLDDQNLLASELADLQGLFQKGDIEHFRSKAEDVRQVFLRIARKVGEQVIGTPSVTADGIRRPIVTSRAEVRAKKPSLWAQLQDIARRMVPPDGGILAADESTGSAGKRLESVGLENTYENRQRMRELMLTVSGQEKAGINSVILYKETFDNVDREGRNLVQHYLLGRGILPGIKTDEGLKPDTQSPYPSVAAVAATATAPAVAAVPGEDIPNPKGLAGLPNMLATYKARGAVFTKWRTTQTIDTVRGLPTDDNIRRNAVVQAQQAKLTQEAGLVPIVEPEVLLDGDHDIAASYKATTRTLQIVFEALVKEGVWLDGVILKTSMILSGNKAASRADSETVGYETLKGLLKSVPAQVAAIVFLSGGQGDDEVVQNLDAVIRAAQTKFEVARDEAVAELKAEGNKKAAQKLRRLKKIPWPMISFSFGRGLQRPGLKVWKGKDENFKEAQTALLQAAQTTQAARLGRLAARSEAGLTPRSEVRELKPLVKKTTIQLPTGLVLPEISESTVRTVRSRLPGTSPFELPVFGRGFLRNGGIAIAQELARAQGGLPAIFLIENPSEQAAIEAWNADQAEGQDDYTPVLWAYTPEELKKKAEPYRKKLLERWGAKGTDGFAFRGLEVEDPKLTTEAVGLRKQLEDQRIYFHVITQGQFFDMATDLGLLDITERLQASLVTQLSA